MSIAKSILFSASVVACASAAVIPQRRGQQEGFLNHANLSPPILKAPAQVNGGVFIGSSHPSIPVGGHKVGGGPVLVQVPGAPFGIPQSLPGKPIGVIQKAPQPLPGKPIGIIQKEQKAPKAPQTLPGKPFSTTQGVPQTLPGEPLETEVGAPTPTSTGAVSSTSSEAEPIDTAAPPAGGAGAAAAVGAATKGLFVQFTAADANIAATADSLDGAVPAIEQEAGTLSWFGAQVSDANGAQTADFVVFDTFADDAGRAAHLGGDVAASVIGQSATFVGGLSIDAFDILAIKEADAAQADTVTVGLHALFEAQADKVADVQTFCTDSLALAEAEAGTTNWLCGQWPGTNKFLILDSFQNQAGRDAHLNGQIAQNLLGLAQDTLVAAPVISQFDVVAASVKGSEAAPQPTGAAAANNAAVPQPTAASNSLTDTAKFGLFVPFTARSETAQAVEQFVQGATGLAAAEPGTLQWFGSASEDAAVSDFLVFDTFATEADRTAHLGGDVAKGLFSQIAALSSVDVIPYDVLAIKSLNDAAAVASETGGVTVGLRVLFNATSAATVPQVQALCQTGLAAIQAEQGTVNWICGQVPGTETFLILDSFANDADRQAHINGQFAQTLLGSVGTLINEPDIQQLRIFAGTVKADDGAAAAGDDAAAGNDAATGDEPTAAAAGDADASGATPAVTLSTPGATPAITLSTPSSTATA